MKRKSVRIWVTVLAVLLLYFIITILYLDVYSSIGGLLFGSILLGLVSLYKFYVMKEKIHSETGFEIFIAHGTVIIIVIFLVYAWYSSIVLYEKGIVGRGLVISSRQETKLENMGENQYAVVTYYYCKANNYAYEIPTRKLLQKGDSIRYLYAPELYDGSGRPPIELYENMTATQGILKSTGFYFIASIIAGVGLLAIWFFKLHSIGVPLLKLKLDSLKSKVAKVVFRLFYAISYCTFILFALALFKNIYEIIPFKFWNILLNTLVFLSVLMTNWGEKLFEFSTLIVLDLRDYEIFVIVKQVFKIAGYLTFALLLYKSLVARDQSIFDLIFNFIERHFDIDINFFKK